MANLPQLTEALHKQYFRLLPLGGYIHSGPADFRMLDIGFARVGYPYPRVKCLIARINKLQSHFGCPSSVGVELQTSIELFILELGVSFTHPFLAPYSKYAPMVTDCWIKTLWEKCDYFKVGIEVCNIGLMPLREGDRWIMPLLASAGHSPETLQRLNWVCIHQQALFISDVLTASGRTFEADCLQPRPQMSRWSRVRFPLQSPTQADFDL
jgi:hypothetical protein